MYALLSLSAFTLAFAALMAVADLLRERELFKEGA